MALAAPFTDREVKTRTGTGGKSFHYVTARTIMNRLDEVVGPESWYDRYIVGQNSVVCELTIILPDGTHLTKCDAGGFAGMSDQGDDEKSGFSDAFKRAAVKFGPARYLYRDGVAHIEQSTPEERAALSAEHYAAAPQAPQQPGRDPKPPVRGIVNQQDLRSYILHEENAQKRAIREEIGAWIKTQGTAYPRKMAQWTDAHVASAMPTIMQIVTRLDNVPAAPVVDRETIPIEDHRPAPAPAEPAGDPAATSIDIDPADPLFGIKTQIVDVVSNSWYIAYGAAPKVTDVQGTVEWWAHEVAPDMNLGDVTIDSLRTYREAPAHRGLLQTILTRAIEERRQIKESSRNKLFGA
jgi:hypothetical protein